MKTTSEPVLDTTTLETLALGVTPIEPSSSVKSALRERILARAASQVSTSPKTHLTVPLSDEDWHDVAPLIKIKTLFESEDGKGVLFRFEPGARLPAHEHDTDEECVVLEGELRIGAATVRAGDFHLARKGIPHGPLTSPTGALFYIRTGIGFKFRTIHA
jgi:quercetin dioxygenase-like cupin family protein